MPRKEKMTVNEAVAYSKECGIVLSRMTVVKYAPSYGYQIGGKGGKWVIEKLKFKEFISGKN